MKLISEQNNDHNQFRPPTLCHTQHKKIFRRGVTDKPIFRGGGDGNSHIKGTGITFIVKVAVDPGGDSRVDPWTTLKML